MVHEVCVCVCVLCVCVCVCVCVCYERLSSFVLSEYLFADDAALVRSCRENMMLAARIFDEVATENAWSYLKTKLLVTGIGLNDDGLAPLQLDGGVVKVVKQFKYLGSLVEACTGIAGGVSYRVELLKHLARAFGRLCSLHQT